MAKTQEFRLTLTRDELKGLLNNMADQVYDFYIQQNEQQQAQKRLVETMPVTRNEQVVQEEAAAYAEPFISGNGNLIYHIDLVKGRALMKKVKSLKKDLRKDLHYNGITILKGTVNSEYPDGSGNKMTYRTTKSKVGIMSEDQRIKISSALSTIGIDIDSIRATPEQVEASKKEKADKKKAA